MIRWTSDGIYIKFEAGEVKATEAELWSLCKLWVHALGDRGTSSRPPDPEREEVEHYLAIEGDND